jgi:CRP-like cAMP-binding protein
MTTRTLAPATRELVADGMVPLPAVGTLATAFRDGRRLRIPAGAVVFTEGDASERVMLLLSGRAKVSMFSETGQETVLGYRGAGEVLGELAAIDGESHLATVTVVEAGEALVVPSARFLAAVEREPGVGLALLRVLVRRQREADRTRADYTALDVEGRVAHRLADLAEEYGRPGADGIRIELSFSQRELAGWVGASREAVNKAIGELERAGLIAHDGRRVVVLELEVLRDRAR